MKKVKHDHKGTKALKLTIFFSLMLAPLMAVLFKCCYVTFNKNAYQSYSDNTSQNIYIESGNDFQLNNTYYFSSYNTGITTTSSNIGAYASRVYFTNLNVIANSTSSDISTAVSIGLYKRANDTYVSMLFFDTNNNQVGSTFNTYNQLTISFTFESEAIDSYFYENNFFYYSQQTNYLDNAFYYAIEEMKDNQLFNWTTNTALYTPTNAMTTGMGITTTALPILITYWLYLTAIYIVIDIVIELFTYLTHMITSRIES